MHEASRASKTRRDLGAMRFITKRIVDTTLTLVLLVPLVPVLALIGLAIKIDSRGPVFFVQDRIGATRLTRNGKTYWDRTVFRVYKFRSMHHGVQEDSHRKYIRDFVNGDAAENEDGPAFKMVGDPRVTRIGKLIRRASIDELPQLLNVLKGEMSLVGPRPVPTYEIDDYAPWHFERFDSLPGITGYWQVYGRGSVPFEEMMKMDIFYVRHQSFWLDAKLLALTLPAVFSARGAS